MYIRVSVTPGARKELLEVVAPDRFAISVKVPAKNNAANSRVIELLASHFRLSSNKFRILTGHRSPVKMISVDEGP